MTQDFYAVIDGKDYVCPVGVFIAKAKFDKNPPQALWTWKQLKESGYTNQKEYPNLKIEAFKVMKVH